MAIVVVRRGVSMSMPMRVVDLVSICVGSVWLCRMDLSMGVPLSGFIYAAR